MLWCFCWLASIGTRPNNSSAIGGTAGPVARLSNSFVGCTKCGIRWRLPFADGMIVDMLPFCLYFVASVITGFHVYTLLALAVYGAPSNPLELVSLLGSLCLLIAAYVSLYKPHAAARLALLACLAIWCFYGPAIAKPIRTRFDKRSSAFSGRSLCTRPQFWRPQAPTTFQIEPEREVILARSFAAIKGLLF